MAMGNSYCLSVVTETGTDASKFTTIFSGVSPVLDKLWLFWRESS